MTRSVRQRILFRVVGVDFDEMASVTGGRAGWLICCNKHNFCYNVVMLTILYHNCIILVGTLSCNKSDSPIKLLLQVVSSWL